MRRPYGEGWVEKHRDKYRARVWDGGSKKTIGTFATAEEADRVLAETVAALAQARPLAGETLESWSKRWLDDRETDGVHRSVRKDRHAFKRVTRHPIAQSLLVSITTKDVRAWVADQFRVEPGKKKRRKPARQTVCNALNLLRVCLACACEKDKIPANPALGVEVPAIASTKEGWTYLSGPEIDLLLTPDAEGPSESQDIYAVAIYTGIRQGELFGLHWSDVQLEGNRPAITVRFSWDGPTKGGRVRSVPLLMPAIHALRRQRARWPRCKLAFPARDGQPRTRDQVPRLSDATALVGIARHVRFHDLRHTCASQLVEGDAWVEAGYIRAPFALERVQKWLGHTSFAVTERYAHLGPNALYRDVVQEAPKAPARAANLPPNLPPKIASIAQARVRKLSKSAE